MIITRDEIDRLVGGVREALVAVMDELVEAGDWRP